MALNIEQTPCCQECGDCEESLYDRTCSVILSTSCVLYNVVGSGPSLINCLGIENGATLTKVLEALCNKINGISGYDVSLFNLSFLKYEYNTPNLQAVIEAIINKLYKNADDIIRLTDYYNSLRNDFESISNFINSPDLSYLYNIGIEEGDSLATIITKIVNKIGQILDNGIGTSSPAIKTVNTNSIAFATSGNLSHTITANVVIAPNADNLLRITGNGLYVAPTKQTISYDPTSRKVCLSNNGGCFILPNDNNSFDETSLVAVNSPTIEFFQSGVKGHTITAKVNIEKLIQEIYNTPELKTQFCNICAPTTCDGMSTSPVWVDTTELRCTGPNLEYKQIDSNICSVTYNTSRWLVKTANSTSCGVSAPDYCISYGCNIGNCFTTSAENCQSVQVCLKDRNTGQLIPAIEDIVVNYVASVNGNPTQYSFSIQQGMVSAEGACHCTLVDSTEYNISNIEFVGQTTNNNGKGYINCGVTYPKSITLVVDCSNNRLVLSGNLHATLGKTIKIYKDSVLYTTINDLDPNIDSFYRIIGSVTQNGVYRAVIEDTSNNSNFASSAYVSVACFTSTPSPNPTFTTPSIVANCVNRTISTSGIFGNSGSINIDLYKNGIVVNTKTNVLGPNYSATFTDINENAYYYIRVYSSLEGTMNSNVYNYTCISGPVTSGNPTISTSPNCSTNQLAVYGSTPNASSISLYLINVSSGLTVDSFVGLAGPNYSVSFSLANITNGSYYVKAVSNDSTSINSTNFTVACNNAATPTVPPENNSVNLAYDCVEHYLTAQGHFNNTAGISMEVYKNGSLVDAKDRIIGTDYTWKFYVTTNGNYTVKVFEYGNASNSITSSIYTISCISSPVVTPTPTITVNTSCNSDGNNNGLIYTGTLGTGTFLTTQVLNSSDNSVLYTFTSNNGPSYNRLIVLTNGSYKIKVFETSNPSNTITSTTIVLACSTVSPVAPTPVDVPQCTRPTGLTTYNLIYSTTQSDVTTEFSSINDACTRGENYYSGIIGISASGITGQATSISVGQLIYSNQTSDCTKVPDKWYFVTESNGANTIHKAIKVVNGAIDSVITCTPSTPAPSPDPVNTGDGILNTGAAAINFIVESNSIYSVNPVYDYDISLKMITAGFEESNQSIKSSSIVSERFMGGSTIETALAVMSKTHSQKSSGNLFYYSTAISLVNLKNKYPTKETVEFELIASAKTTEDEKASRINVSSIETAGLVSKSFNAVTGLDYDYSSSSTVDSAGGYWNVYPVSGENVVPKNNPVSFVRVSINLNTKRVTFTQLRGFDSTKPVTIPKTYTI